MSRFSLTRSLGCSLLVTLCASLAPTTAFAKRVAPGYLGDIAVEPALTFAQPPPVAPIDRADIVVAPRQTLDRATVRAALVSARARNLAAFRAYQKAGVFPSNTFKGQKLNVWYDADGHYCAAATIIRASGQDLLVAKVAEQNNFIRLADVKQGPLMDWILTSGFTQDEIAAIQEPFMPVAREPALAPAEPVLVDAKLRKAEDARLRARYKTVDKMIVKNAAKSLDLATDRLMKHPELAWQLVAATPVEID